MRPHDVQKPLPRQLPVEQPQIAVEQRPIPFQEPHDALDNMWVKPLANPYHRGIDGAVQVQVRNLMLLQVGKPFRQHQEQPPKMLLVFVLVDAVERKNKGFRPMKESHHAMHVLTLSSLKDALYLQSSIQTGQLHEPPVIQEVI